MKFTLSWLKDHLETTASTAQIVEAMTMAGLEVEHVEDPAARLAPFTVAKIVEAVQHPNADRLRVCQVDTVDGVKEIVCGAANARAGITVVYAPIGAYIPGSGITLVEKPVRGVVSNGMLCSESELETAEESDGILELPGDLPVGTPVAQALGLESVIDFEVTPNRPDWLGVAGIARDLAAAGVGKLKDLSATSVKGAYPSPIGIRIDAPDACPTFAGRTIKGVRNGPSPEWLQKRLRSIGLRPINRLVDVTNLISYDRARPLHVYDIAKLAGPTIVARLGHSHEHLIALDGKTYAIDHEMCVIADAGGERPIGLGGVMGGESTGCSDATVDVFVESAWFDPIRTAQTGRTTGITSDAQYRFARGVDPAFVVPGLELATRLILELCGGEASEVVVAGQAPAPLAPVDFDPAYVQTLSGLKLPEAEIYAILSALGFERQGGAVQPPTWRRDIDGKADLVEEVSRIAGFDKLPATALPEVPRAVGGVLTTRQARTRQARRKLAALGYAEAVTWSFTARRTAELFGGGARDLEVANPIAADLDCMRPSILPNLIAAAQRNADRGFADVALFEIGPVYRGDGPTDQAIVATALIAARPGKRWDGQQADALFELKADLFDLLEDLGAPVGSLQIEQGAASPWFHPGRSAVIQLGPKARIAEFGELHPGVLKTMDAEGPMVGFELVIAAIPEPKKKATKTKPALNLSPLMPLRRDFAFVVDQARPAGDLVRAAAGADKALIEVVRVFDVYQGKGVPDGMKSIALEVVIQPKEATLTEAEIETLSAKIVVAAEKLGAKLRG